jgi:hypothetical protein
LHYTLRSRAGHPSDPRNSHQKLPPSSHRRPLHPSQASLPLHRTALSSPAPLPDTLTQRYQVTCGRGSLTHTCLCVCFCAIAIIAPLPPSPCPQIGEFLHALSTHMLLTLVLPVPFVRALSWIFSCYIATIRVLVVCRRLPPEASDFVGCRMRSGL